MPGQVDGTVFKTPQECSGAAPRTTGPCIEAASASTGNVRTDAMLILLVKPTEEGLNVPL